MNNQKFKWHETFWSVKLSENFSKLHKRISRILRNYINVKSVHECRKCDRIFCRSHTVIYFYIQNFIYPHSTIFLHDLRFISAQVSRRYQNLAFKVVLQWNSLTMGNRVSHFQTADYIKRLRTSDWSQSYVLKKRHRSSALRGGVYRYLN